MSKRILWNHYEELKTSMCENSNQLNEVNSTRLHRSLSWLKAAAEQIEAENLDQAFISLWVSFSACFYIEGEEPIAPFIDKIISLDDQQKIYECLWHEYSSSVKALIKNPYVYDGFWQAQRLQPQQVEESFENMWRPSFDLSSIKALNYLSRKKVAPLFSIVLDRLYVLRNQVLQGGATYQSRVNREQVTDGVNLLACIMPIIISIMLNSSDQDWGEIAYPVI